MNSLLTLTGLTAVSMIGAIGLLIGFSVNSQKENKIAQPKLHHIHKEYNNTHFVKRYVDKEDKTQKEAKKDIQISKALNDILKNDIDDIDDILNKMELLGYEIVKKDGVIVLIKKHS